MSLASPSLLRESVTSLSAYQSHGGYEALVRARTDVETLRSIIYKTSLTGLGGAHFPFSSKLQSALEADGPRTVICNLAEDEPGSRKDQVLVERNPHVVLEGAMIAATALDASLIYLYVSEELTTSSDALYYALAELENDQQLLPPDLQIRIYHAPKTYVAGETSAVIEAIEGREAKPISQPPYATERGIGGKATLVSNCESLANLPRILSRGLDAPLSNEGTLSRLATVTGDVAFPGVFEVQPEKMTFGDLITLAGGIVGSSSHLKAIQPGGPSTSFLDATAADVLLTNAAIEAVGSQSGCLAVRVLSSRRCLVEELYELTTFFAREQCGKCPACRMKTQAYANVVQKIRDKRGSWRQLEQLSAVDTFVSDMPHFCALISMPTKPLMSALQLFRGDFEDHIDRLYCASDEV